MNGERPRLAGLVLAVIGVFSFGSTSPFAAVLCLEWLRDPARRPDLKKWDLLGLILSVPGSVVVAAWFTPDAWANTLYFGPGPVIAYWVGFAGWVAYRGFRLGRFHRREAVPR